MLISLIYLIAITIFSIFISGDDFSHFFYASLLGTMIRNPIVKRTTDMTRLDMWGGNKASVFRHIRAPPPVFPIRTGRCNSPPPPPPSRLSNPYTPTFQTAHHRRPQKKKKKALRFVRRSNLLLRLAFRLRIDSFYAALLTGRNLLHRKSQVDIRDMDR